MLKVEAAEEGDGMVVADEGGRGEETAVLELEVNEGGHVLKDQAQPRVSDGLAADQVQYPHALRSQPCRDGC